MAEPYAEWNHPRRSRQRQGSAGWWAHCNPDEAERIGRGMTPFRPLEETRDAGETDTAFAVTAGGGGAGGRAAGEQPAAGGVCGAVQWAGPGELAGAGAA